MNELNNSFKYFYRTFLKSWYTNLDNNHQRFSRVSQNEFLTSGKPEAHASREGKHVNMTLKQI